MPLLSPLLFGISANLDALLIGMSYGLRHVRISFVQSLAISLITFLGSFLSVGLGKGLAPILPAQVTSCIGSVLLILFGGYLLLKFFTRKGTEQTSSETVFTKQARVSPTRSEVLLLGVLLSLNNIGIGFGTGMTGIPMMPTMIVTLFLSLTFLILGNRLGTSRILTIIATIADPLSGLLLICLGLLERLI